MTQLKNLIQERLRWSKYVSYIDGRISRFSLFVPIIGYLILFNDQISEAITFKTITNSNELESELTGLQRLQLIYFGFISLGLSNLFFKISKPKTFNIATNYMEFTNKHIESSNFMVFDDMYEHTKNRPHILSFQIFQDQYKTFKDDYHLDKIRNTNDDDIHVKNPKNWQVITNKNGDFLRSLLEKFFIDNDKSRNIPLSICIILSTLGYSLLAIPSIDLFIKVIFATI